TKELRFDGDGGVNGTRRIQGSTVRFWGETKDLDKVEDEGLTMESMGLLKEE
ncbi:hypothetical protein A2U01_0084293, partial [Trifolium medium]|nr:hypothetical protein [Trifolium medium]